MSSTSKRDGNTFTFSSAMVDPLTGKPTRVEEKVVGDSKDRHTMEMCSEAPDGSMFKSMEIVDTRKK